jgi:hypothetical protein
MRPATRLKDDRRPMAACITPGRVEQVANTVDYYRASAGEYPLGAEIIADTQRASRSPSAPAQRQLGVYS